MVKKITVYLNFLKNKYFDLRIDSGLPFRITKGIDKESRRVGKTLKYYTLWPDTTASS